MEITNVSEYEAIAKQKLPKMVYDYYASGAEDQWTLQENRNAFSRILFRPRILIDVSKIDMATTVLGFKISMPIMIAPTAMQKMAHPEGEYATARAASAAGTIMTLSSWATSSVEEVASTGPGIRFFQLYVYKDRNVVAQLVRRAERAGFKAIALTVDTPRLGRREADIKNRFTLPPFLTLKNFEGLDLGKMDQAADSGLASYVAGQIDRSLSWKDVKWLQTITRLPILVKGVLTAEDTRLAIQAGAAGIIVSNHGARQLDYVPATIMALEEVVKAAQGRVPVFLDGGVRRGTDVFKALALGASGIFIGRPVVFSLAAEGEAGIRKVLQMLRDEFELTMALSGCRSLKEITRDHIMTEWDLPRSHPVPRFSFVLNSQLKSSLRERETIALQLISEAKTIPFQMPEQKEAKFGRRGRAAVVVLGDIGRSPRMQYHALSLARQASLEVDIVAYGGSDPHSAVLEHQCIHIYKMTQWPTIPRSLPKILYPLMLLLKPFVQFLMLLWFLCVKIPAPDVFIVQNPPSVPTLIAVKWASWLRRSTFIVDWHNFGYTLLGLSLGRRSRFVALYHWFEKHYGKMANGSLCVTRAMQHELAQNWGIKATVLYDQPPEFFRPASLTEKHKLFCRIDKNLNQPYGIQDCISNGMMGMESHDLNETLFTTQTGTDIFLKQNRPALVVSSTSWTPDEDFGILLEAAVMYDRRIAAILKEDDSTGEEVLWKEMYDGNEFLYPRLLFIITGKGPEKEKYEEKIRKLHLKRVAFRTMWLSAEDYPLLLGSADLGVCLHTSSSGLDLPMKVVDMFGCGLPVCAVSYSCIKELVKVEKNGLLFSSSLELADELLMLFKGFPDECDALKSLRNGALEIGSSARWATEWEENAKPLIFEVIHRNFS
ncbi:hypothetical protein F0562_010477 [Nyssa sinensis]|uniref:(S)-2-hydroxy-acid oxidase n=3 Tax=Magnoliopsida TaxID=3398 RepID=A0A5J5A2U1_9ASTE|nr:hypothetical protein F0562_010477 [Nyssa sinensis]